MPCSKAGVEKAEGKGFLDDLSYFGPEQGLNDLNFEQVFDACSVFSAVT